jgi:hypothetical protein
MSVIEVVVAMLAALTRCSTLGWGWMADNMRGHKFVGPDEHRLSRGFVGGSFFRCRSDSCEPSGCARAS